MDNQTPIDAIHFAAAMSWHEQQAIADGTRQVGVLPNRCAVLVDPWYRASSQIVTISNLSDQQRTSFLEYLTASQAGSQLK